MKAELRTKILKFNKKARELENKGYKTQYNFSKKVTEVYEVKENGFIKVVGILR